MQITKKTISPTVTSFHVVADADELADVKQHVVADLSKNVKIQGFREGKAPQTLIEKNIDPATLQSNFLDHALNDFWNELIRDQQLRPVAQPKVSVSKFVPFTTLEADYEVTLIGDITLPDYKKFRLAKPISTVDAKQVDEVLQNLRTRSSDKQTVDRAAKDGDEVTIDFAGVDAKTKTAIAGADGKDYPLVIGSNTFIPGFEPELVGLKSGDEKTFTITFPKDYGAKELQSRKVSFTVTVKQVQELSAPKLDDAFAATVGPFKTLAELKADIKKQLQSERDEQARREYESKVLEMLADKTKVAIPDALIDEEVRRAEDDERRDLSYRGQTWQEHLKEEGISEEQHRAKNRPAAELRVKAGLVLSEVADREDIRVTPEELEIRMQLLKGQYTDPAMLAELDKAEARRDINSRMLSEKTITKLCDYASAK